MHGFFDSLRIELRGTGVDVTVACPGFAATQIRGNALGADGQPLRQSKHDESTGNMDVDTCVAIILRAMERREREVVMTTKARVAQFLKLVAPGVVERIAAQSLRYWRQ